MKNCFRVKPRRYLHWTLRNCFLRSAGVKEVRKFGSDLVHGLCGEKRKSIQPFFLVRIAEEGEDGAVGWGGGGGGRIAPKTQFIKRVC